ncbi:MAG TPA: flagellar basal body-associated FliL family protein [Acidothermaceae bacterium]|jgi:flagellar FliL protein
MTTMTDKPGKVADASAESAAPKKKKGKKKLVIGLVLVVALGGVAKVEFLSPKKDSHAAVVAKPGPLVALDAVTVNLAGGHYLRVGVTVQFTDKVSASAPPDGAPALDQVIGYFTGQDGAPLQTGVGLEKAKEGLEKEIADVYPKEPVYDVLFTSFVVQ